MLLFREWEIRTSKIEIKEEHKIHTGELSFRRLEKIILYLTKHIIQWIILSSVKAWFIIITKTKFWIKNNLPKVNKLFQKKVCSDSRKISFVEKAIVESRIKIKKAKDKIKKDHEELNNKVDKIL